MTLYVDGANGYTGDPSLFQLTFEVGGVPPCHDLAVPASNILVLQSSLSPTSLTAGQTVVVQGTVRDLNGVGVGGATITVSWGDSSTDAQATSASNGSFTSPSHAYSQGSYTVQVTALKNGFIPDSRVQSVTVAAGGGAGGFFFVQPTPTSTSVPFVPPPAAATATATPTAIATATPTATAIPISTPTPTTVPAPVTPVPATPTPTSVPTPTATPGVVPAVGPGFTVSDLSVSPDSVEAGVPVTIRFTVTNTGPSEATFTVYITVDGQVETVVTATLAAGASRTFIETVVRGAAGTYSVGVDGLVDSLVVLPAQVELFDLDVSPNNVGPGDTVTISARVTNVGGSPGDYQVAFTIAGSTEKTFTGTLPVGSSEALLLKTSRGDSGTYSVTADGLSDQFIVLAPVVDLEIPQEILISEVATQAIDAEGNTLQLTGNSVRLQETETGDIQVELPVALATGKQLAEFQDLATGVRLVENELTIPILDQQGNEAMRIVAEVASTEGTGTTARVTLKTGTLRLEVPEKAVDLSADDPLVGEVVVSLSAQLIRLPQGAQLRVTTKKTLSPDAYSGFELLARDGNNTIADVGAAVEINRANLGNVTDVGTVTLRLSVGRPWVEEHGGIENIVIARRTDGGSRQFLPTTFVGEDEQGRMVFEGVSEEGFSIFSILALAPLSPDLLLSDLSVQPEVVEPGEAVKITVKVINRGGAAGSRSVLLEVNGEPEDVRNITLEPGAETTVTFLVLQEQEGSYQVGVEGLVGAFEVAVPLSPALLSATDIQVSPAQVDLGQGVTISVTVTNIGDKRGKFDVFLKVNGALMDIQPVLIPGEASQDVTFTFTPQVPGSYTVEVHGLTGDFEVLRPLTLAQFTLLDLMVSPEVAQPGEPVVVTVTLANQGEQAGTFTITLRIDGAVEESREVSLKDLTTVPITFEVVRTEPGTYTLEVEDLRATFEVRTLEVPGLQVSVQVEKERVRPDETFTVSVEVTNTAAFAVTKVLNLEVNGAVVDSREVSVGPGETVIVPFELTLEERGNYVIAVEGVEVAVEVVQPLNWALIIGFIVLGAGALAIGAVALIRRRWPSALAPIATRAADWVRRRWR